MSERISTFKLMQGKFFLGGGSTCCHCTVSCLSDSNLMTQWIGFCFVTSPPLPSTLFFSRGSWGFLFTVLVVHNEIPLDNVGSQWHSFTPQNHCPQLKVVKRFSGALCCSHWRLFSPAGTSIDQFQLCRQDNESWSHLFSIAVRSDWIIKKKWKEVTFVAVQLIIKHCKHIHTEVACGESVYGKCRDWVWFQPISRSLYNNI